MIGTAHVDEAVCRALAGPPLGQLLEAALGALERGRRGIGRDLGAGKRPQPGARRLPAAIEEDRRGERLERRGEQGRPSAAATERLALPQEEVLAKLDPAGEAGEAARADDGGPTGGQDSLVVLGVACVQRLGDDEADDGVAEELEALVVAGGLVRMLVQPRSVDEGARKQRGVVEGEPEPLGELGRRTRRDPRFPRP